MADIVNLQVTNLQPVDFWIGPDSYIPPNSSLTIREDSLSERMAKQLRRAELLKLVSIQNGVDNEEDVGIRAETHVLTQADNLTRLHFVAGYQTRLIVEPNTLSLGFRCAVTNDQAYDIEITAGSGMMLVPVNARIPANSVIDLVVSRPNRLLLAVPAGTLDHDHPQDGSPQWDGRFW